MPWNAVSVSNPVPGSLSRGNVLVLVRSWIWTVLIQDNETGEARHCKVHDLRPEGQARQRQPRLRPSSWSISRSKMAQRARAFRDHPPLTGRSGLYPREGPRTGRRGGAASPHCTVGWSSIGAVAGSPHSGRQSVASVRDSLGLTLRVEAVLSTTIDEVYLGAQKRSVSYTCNEVVRRCRNAGLALPHVSTVRRRIKALSAQETLRRREGWQSGAGQVCPMHGAFPDAPGHLPWCRSTTRWSI